MGNLCGLSKKHTLEDDFERPYQQCTFGGGCFWCIEAAMKHNKGVINAISGYAGGEVDNPTYKEVKTGTTGHAEVVQVTYNPSIITFEQILTVFFKVHDPTTLNRQGGDKGTQYRSTIMYHTQEQKQLIEKFIENE